MPEASLSIQLLELLQVLDYPAARIEYLRDHFQLMIEEEPLFETEEERLEAEQIREIMRKLTKEIIERRREPRLGSRDQLTSLVLETMGDAALDEYFTLEVLAAVPGIVSRWKRLKELLVELAPDNRVRSYLRQATTCYLYGLPDATAVLCRAAVEAALKEVLGKRGVPIQELDLEGLIRMARLSRFLTDELSARADRIRRVGNASVHRVRCSEAEAGVQVRETADVLVQIYAC